MGCNAQTDAHMDSSLISRISGQSQEKLRETSHQATSRSPLMSALSLRELIKITLCSPDNVRTPLHEKQMPWFTAMMMLYVLYNEQSLIYHTPCHYSHIQHLFIWCLWSTRNAFSDFELMLVLVVRNRPRRCSWIVFCNAHKRPSYGIDPAKLIPHVMSASL